MSTELERTTPSVPMAAAHYDLAQVMELSRVMAVSSLLPTSLRGKPADVLVAIMYGQEIGLAPMQAIQSVYVVNGRPTISAQLWVALARRAGHKVRVLDESPESCTVEVERADDPGRPTRVTYTLEQAKKAKLATKEVWQQHAHAMLYARAVSTACRRACPEIALGFGDETDREPAEPEQRPSLAQVAAERTDRTDPTPATEPDPEPLPSAEPMPAEDDPDAAYLADLREIEAEHTGAADQLPLGTTPDEVQAEPSRQQQLTRIAALLTEHGVKDRDVRLEVVSRALGDRCGSMKDLTRTEAEHVLSRLEEWKQNGTLDNSIDDAADTVDDRKNP